MGPEDARVFAALADLVDGGRPIEGAEVDEAEALLARHPRSAETGQLLQDVLGVAARQARERGRSVTALRYLERLTDHFPESSSAWQAFVQAQVETGDWREVERVVRRGLSALPDDPWLAISLAEALGRQGRDEDAADGLRRYLARHEHPAVRARLERLERELKTVAGLTEGRSAHFNVRFEGEADDALGEALLKMLEDKYEMLARTLDCEPDRTIPVILLPRETFRSATEAPGWAGAYYSHSDARIRIGTRDLSPGFVPLDLERTLTHELAHAFIHARTGGAVPDDLNEGLAQYLSGRRLGYRLDPRRAEVHDNRMKVDDFYDAALSFVEFLIDRYRQPTLNDLLKYAGQTGNADQAFRRALHQSYDETREEWLRSLQ
jgi:tetratricopeptide (TPR) repeat protein